MFGGLAAKLKEKKLQQQQQGPSTSPSTSNSEYVSRSQILEEARSKRPRAEENALGAPPAITSDAGGNAAVPTPSGDVLSVVLMSESAFDAIKQRAIEEIDALLAVASAVPSAAIASAPVHADGDASQQERPLGESAPVVLGIPETNVQCLLRHQNFYCGLMPLKELSSCLVCVEDTAGPKSDTASVSEQTTTLCNSMWRRPDDDGIGTHTAATPPAYMRAVVAKWLWRGLLLWRRSVLAQCTPYLVYLGEMEQLSGDEVRRLGSSIASMREQMREYSRAHSAITRLLVALLMDLSNGSTETPSHDANKMQRGAQSNKSATDAAAEVSLLPSAITNGLFDVVVLANHGKYEASEQAYYQTVIGSEKWRLGLYSAGDMHMRRSLEKTQRDRVRHLLNNDTAMASLHAVKRLIALVGHHTAV